MKWHRTNPVFPVADVAASIEWYQAIFGLAPGHVNQALDGPNYAVLVHEGTSILHLLRKDDAPHGLRAPVEAQFWIDGDIDDLFATVTALGAKVIEPPGRRPWRHRDFIVADLDSNLVWITTPLERAPS
jgi:catechol 2,3-dioxygenase-like lactoylglutathione lyase family enzyme